jgi:hypothetical protein
MLMKLSPILMSAVLAMAGAACRNDGGEEVTEIRGGGPNSDLVRIPISADQPLDTTQVARITFAEKEFDFGEVKEGAIVEHSFRFTNTGGVPLTIYSARSSCGCTVPAWPEEPLAPGESGEIKVTFNTDDRTELQKKLIVVLANTYPNETKVLLKGYVKPD